jgi:hypothetical protein
VLGEGEDEGGDERQLDKYAIIHCCPLFDNPKREHMK